MRVNLSSVAKGPKDSALPPTTLEFTSGAVAFARAETERRPTVLGLIASGRMRPDTGSVTIDGHTDYAAMRRQIALVDALGVSEPAADVMVEDVVAEELMFAGLRRKTTQHLLAGLGLADRARWDMGDLAPDDRIRLLTELAVLRDGVLGLVLTSPDRHGGDPLGWWDIAGGLAARGYAVLVIAGDASAHAIADLELANLEPDGVLPSGLGRSPITAAGADAL